MPKLKGVWKFNKTVNLVDNLSIGLDFTNHIQPYQTYGDEPDKVMTYSQIDVSSNSIVYHIRQYDIGGEYGSSRQVYSSAAGWTPDSDRLLIFVGEYTVSTEFYDWFTANAEDITDSVTQIFYNGRLIGVLENGERVTIPCKGLPMIEDIIITAPKTNIA